ncbi:hypothetical protein LZP73_20765, partial [Shewanella sp. AS16]|uniref:hypothetical protein n=1 Tax=Shewanella sp. AS16 TaxID=2907625 RepID=UPI001F46DE03
GVPYKPQTQGANETRHRRLKFFLRTALTDDADDWPYHLKWVQTQMNECADPVTGTTPAHYFRGRYSELQIPYNKDEPDRHELPWLEKVQRIHNV